MSTGMANAILFIKDSIKNEFISFYFEQKYELIDQVKVYFGQH